MSSFSAYDSVVSRSVIIVDRFAPETRALRAELDARFAPLRRDARVTVRSKSLLGEGYVEIAPGPRSAPAVPDVVRLVADEGDEVRARVAAALGAAHADADVAMPALLRRWGAIRALLGGSAVAEEKPAVGAELPPSKSSTTLTSYLLAWMWK